MKNLKQILVAVGVAAISFTASAQYTSDHLVATNTFLNVFPTNLVSANYAYAANIGVSFPGNGIFEMKPQTQDESFAAEGGVAYQLIYVQTSVTNQNVATTQGQQTNIVATFQLLLDDYTLQKLGSLASLGAMSNAPTYTVTFQVQPGATNISGGYWQTIVQGPMTNSLGAKWSKLVGFTATGFTNGLVIQSLRAGYPQSAGSGGQ